MKNEDDQTILALILAVVGVSLLLPCLILKSVKEDPSFFEGLGVRDTAKTAGFLLVVAGILSLLLWVFPPLGEWTLFRLYHFKFRSGILISWAVSNLVLGSITYGTIPYWRRWLNKNCSGQIY